MTADSDPSLVAGGLNLSLFDIPVLLLHPEGEVLACSSGAEELLCTEGESLRNTSLRNFYAHEHDGDLLQDLAGLQPGQIWTLNARFRSRNGSVVPVKAISRRLDDGQLLLTLIDISEEERQRRNVARLKGELSLAYQQVDRIVNEQGASQQETKFEVSVLHQIGRALLSTIDLDKVLYIILTCVTAHPAFGFSRAFLLLVDEEAGTLSGKMGVGPRNVEEAYQTWRDLSQANWGLEEFLAQYDRLYPEGDLPLSRVIQRYNFPLRQGQDVLIDAALACEAIQVDDASQDSRVSGETREILGCNQFVVVPLVANEKSVGVVVADNLYKDRAITPRDVRLLGLFATQAAMGLQNANMYSKLREHVARLKEVQEQLIRVERLSAIGEMTAKVAHEIRNPLVTIGGFARSVRRSLEPDSTQARKCEIIAEEILRLEEILGSLLDFSRKKELHLEEARPEEIIGQVCSLMRDEIRASDVKVVRDIQTEIPSLLIDTGKIKQVLINLVKNAMDAMPGGGTITLSVCLQGRFVNFKIADTGEGIPPDLLPNIFNPFFTTKSEGFGLGLAICRTYIYDHAGNISVVSVPGEGTTFEILLPLPAVTEAGDDGADE